MPTAAIALGSNLNNREAHIRAAFEALSTLPDTTLLARSQVFETAPVGPIPQGPYLNAAAKLSTTLSPHDLLAHCLTIERAHGRYRVKEQRWGPRTLDLDLLLYDDRVIDEPNLQLPHPRLHERLFVLEPLAQVWPDALVPGLNKTVAQLLVALRPAVPSPR